MVLLKEKKMITDVHISVNCSKNARLRVSTEKNDHSVPYTLLSNGQSMQATLDEEETIKIREVDDEYPEAGGNGPTKPKPKKDRL